MPQIKSQMKRVRTNNKKNLVVKAAKSEIKTAIKAVLTSVENKDTANASTAFDHANMLLDKAVSSHTYHVNYASRQKSRLSKLVNSIA